MAHLPNRTKVWVGSVTLGALAALTVWISLAGGVSEQRGAAFDAGASALWRALSGEAGALDDARRSFRRAVGGPFSGRAPHYALGVVLALEQGAAAPTNGSANKPHPAEAAIVAALRARDLDAAEARARATTSAHEHPALSLVTSLRRAASAGALAHRSP